MKPEHRHELKTNELAQFISDFPKWCKENTKMIAYVLIVCVLVAGSAYLKYNKNSQSLANRTKISNLASSLSLAKLQLATSKSEIDQSATLLQIADELGIAASKVTGDNAAFALIKQAEAIRSQLHYRDQQPDAATIKNQCERAIHICQQAADIAKSATFKAMAIFSTGLCQEELGDFDSAKKSYNSIIENDTFLSTVSFKQAKLRLDIMDNYKDAVTFLPAPEQPQSINNAQIPSFSLPQDEADFDGPQQ